MSSGVVEQPVQQITNVESSVVADPNTKKEPTAYWVYFVIGAVVLAILYFAYTKFVENSSKEGVVQERERDDPVADYILADAIEELQKMQKDILKNLSNDTGI